MTGLEYDTFRIVANMTAGTHQIQELPRLSEAHEAIWKRAAQMKSLDPGLGLGP